LAHYLGADIRLEPGVTPMIRTPGHSRILGALPAFQWEVASLLRRTFLLDCLVRNAGPHGTNLAEQPLLSDVGLDACALYDASIGSRVDAYLAAPFERISEALPEWHLSMYIDPTFEHVRTLPYLLQNVPNVFLPESEPLASRERLQRSLDEFYRKSGRDAVSVDPIKPSLGPGRTHGWLSEGAPIDAFKALPSAYPNRLKYLQRSNDPISVVAVLNDDEMTDEHAEASRIYRQRATELDIDIEVREHLSTDQLAEVFEMSHDFVH
jgi:hypothetical protein